MPVMPTLVREGVPIYWEEHGAGPPLLMVQGFGFTLDMWHRVLPHLTPHRRVIVFDNRGVGRTGAVAKTFTLEDMADDAMVVLTAAGIDRSDVFGISMGGLIAKTIGLRHPNRIRRLVLGCTSIAGPGGQNRQRLVERADLPLEEALRFLVPVTYDAATDPSVIEADLDIRRRNYPSRNGYHGQLDALLSYTCTAEELHGLTMPVLVIHGESDRMVPLASGQALAAAIPGARMSVIPHASHVFFSEQPEVAARLILQFLDEPG
jgi:pimeloyl-ACP methyl ester carboxylesterase